MCVSLTEFSFWGVLLRFNDGPAQSDVALFALSSCVSRREASVGLLPVVVVFCELFLQEGREREGGREGGREGEEQVIEGRRENYNAPASLISQLILFTSTNTMAAASLPGIQLWTSGGTEECCRGIVP